MWSEELRSPILVSKYFKDYVLDAMWSPARPGVFATVKGDGTLDLWDIYWRQNEPSLTLHVSTDGLRCVRFQEKGALLATGSLDGPPRWFTGCLAQRGLGASVSRNNKA